MCWMMVKKAGLPIPMEYMDKAQAHNEDGYGVSWYEDNRVNTYKTFNYALFKRVVLALQEKTLVVHLRYATKGSKDYENIHPFDIPSGVVFHNGTMNKVTTTGTLSDSRSLAETISKCDYNYIEDIAPLINHFVDDKINRLVFFENNGSITIINKELGIEEDGIWYSNDYHLKEDSWCRYTYNKPITYSSDYYSKKFKDVIEERNNKVFVYGTLKRGNGNHRLLENAVYLGKAKTLVKWAMINNASKSFPYLLEKNNNGHYIQGEVYSVTDAEMRSLDGLEGFPHHYNKEKVQIVYTDDTSIETVTAYVKATIPKDYSKEILLSNWYK